MNKPEFVLDSNVLMAAHRSYYAFDIAPKFWDSLIVHAKTKRICSIDRVKKEIEDGKDALWTWSKGNISNAFISTDAEEVVNEYKIIMEWANTQSQYNQAAKSEFARVADSWLIAFAKSQTITVVTDEKHDPNIKRKIPIPNVCKKYGIPYIGTFDLIRKLGIKFD